MPSRIRLRLHGSRVLPALLLTAVALGAAAPAAQARETDTGAAVVGAQRSPDGVFSLNVSGLFQSRYTFFDPKGDVMPLGGTPGAVNNFDVYLGRLAVSGTAFDTRTRYFLQMQGSTAGNGNTLSMLDWFVSREVSSHLTIQAGRFWTAYTYEYNDNPGNYLFADLSTAEFAFVLPRAVGVQASGTAGRFGWAGMVSNGIAALDAAGQENFGSRVAWLGHVQVDLLQPYGGLETDPDPAGVKRPELTLWFSVASNPVVAASQFENVAAGDRTTNATGTAGYRQGFLTLQGTGYFRRTHPGDGAADSDASGFAEQAGYYVRPGRLELAERVSGVRWGAVRNLPVVTTPVNTWYAGPTFPYETVLERSVGVNFYMHGHHAKLQVSYSYLSGLTFSDARYGASRVWVQEQLQF
ncbi:MAG: hypothetical protein KGN76_12965 [Acidobacteriota bacterium]|nr:hypothetical protein [Acidobacteriota bacterium]